MSSEQSIDPQAIEQTKRQIRGLVDELAALSKQGLEPQVYYAEFLKRVVEALAAVGGAVWTLGEGGFELAYQINLQRSSLDVPGDHQARHARLLGQVVNSGEGLLVPPHSGSGDEGEGANPTELLLVLAPLRSDKHIEGVVEIFQRPTPKPATRRGYLRFLLQMCELAGEWFKSHKLQQLGHRESLWGQVDRFARAVHESLDVRLSAYTIANEAQRLIGCDRVSVAIRRGRKCKVEAVSGQDTFDERSNVVTLLGELAARVVASGEPLWYTGSEQDLPPQVEEAVHEYIDHSHSKTVAVLPLEEVRAEAETIVDIEQVESEQEAKIIAALIVEQVDDVRPREVLADRVELVCQHSSRALTNALDYNNLFLMPLWRLLGRSRVLVEARNLPKTLLALAAFTILVVAAFVVRVPFELKGEGALQPTIRRDVFADIEGRVIRVTAEHGQRVEAGQVLAVLENTDLEVQLADVLGQWNTAGKQLSSVKRLRYDKNLPRDERESLAGQVLQLEQRLESLRQQHQLLQTKKAQLTVKSPIAGQVISWDVQRQLTNRTVAPGQVLMTVADPGGSWELEVYMPEKRMGHVRTAEAEQEEPLEVEYVVATDPTETHEGQVRMMHAAAEMHEEHGHAVRLLVDIDSQDLKEPRPGASVTAKVDCGRASLGYVWLHEMYEFIQSRILFNF